MARKSPFITVHASSGERLLINVSHISRGSPSGANHFTIALLDGVEIGVKDAEGDLWKRISEAGDRT